MLKMEKARHNRWHNYRTRGFFLSSCVHVNGISLAAYCLQLNPAHVCCSVPPPPSCHVYTWQEGGGGMEQQTPVGDSLQGYDYSILWVFHYRDMKSHWVGLTFWKKRETFFVSVLFLNCLKKPRALSSFQPFASLRVLSWYVIFFFFSWLLTFDTTVTPHWHLLCFHLSSAAGFGLKIYIHCVSKGVTI